MEPLSILIVISLAAAVVQAAWVGTVMARLEARRRTASEGAAAPRADGGPPPGVSIIRPIYGLDENLRQNLTSWIEQKYGGPVQHIFSFQDPDDAALPVARQVKAAYPEADIAITVNPVIPGLSGKASNLHWGAARARHGIFVFADSDITAMPGTLAALAGGVAANPREAHVGVPLPAEPRGLGGALMGVSVYMTVLLIWLGSVTAWRPMGRRIGLPGGTVALTRRALDAVGGVKAFGNHITEDLKLGQFLGRKGYTVVPSAPVSLIIGRAGFSQYWRLSLRGNRGLMGLSPAVYALWAAVAFWYYGPALAGPLIGRPEWMLAVPAMIAGRTIILGLLIASMRRDQWYLALAYPLFELLSLPGLLIPPLTARSGRVVWRGIEYRLSPAGEIVGAGAPPTAAPGRSVPKSGPRE